MSPAYLFLVTLLASAVEAVEALTIVLAVGTTRGWRSTLYGVGSAGLVLAVLVATLGPALGSIPIDSLRIVVGTLLVLFGLQWLYKAILRAAGLKAQRDEAAAFARETEEARTAKRVGGRVDWYSFTLSFKGVLLEGLEVVFIVIAFGAAQSRIALAALAAAAAVVIVVVAGFVVHGPLARVPENALKFTVGIMLTSFGIFWVGEGVGASWPGGDSALLAIIAFMALGSAAIVAAVRPRNEATA